MSTFTVYEDIESWQLGRELVKTVYVLTSGDKFSKDWGFRDQIQRAAISICSNIAEGYERRGNKEFIKFLWIAKGSTAEVSSQLYHALDLGYISQDQFQIAYGAAKTIAAKLFSLIKKISSSDQGLDYVKL